MTKTSTRPWRVLALGVILLAAGRAEAQVRQGGYGPRVGFGMPVGPGFLPGGAAIAYGPFGTNAVDVLGGVGAYTGYGSDITGWGTGYGTGWGFGYANPYIGYGAGYGAFGESPYTLEIGREQQYALNESRFNMMNAEAAMAYQAANLYQQRAVGEAESRYRQAKTLQPRYQIATGATRFDRRHHGALQLIPREKLLDSNGRVQWPGSTPSGQRLSELRQAVDDAIQKVAQEAKDHGRASVRSVVAARNALAEFSGSALERLRSDSPTDAASFQAFLQSLDHTLYTMAEGGAASPHTAGTAGGGTSLTPDNARKTGGDVLKESIKKDDASTPRVNGDTPKDVRRDDAAPKS